MCKTAWVCGLSIFAIYTQYVESCKYYVRGNIADVLRTRIRLFVRTWYTKCVYYFIRRYDIAVVSPLVIQGYTTCDTVTIYCDTTRLFCLSKKIIRDVEVGSSHHNQAVR